MSDAAASGYQLLEEPWIRVLDLQARERSVSLREVFAEAHELDRLAGELPTQDFAVLRILLAVLYRALDPREQRDPCGAWGELWRAERLPMDRIDPYLEQWRDRFDLLHPSAPFLQTPDLRTAKGEWKALDILVADSDDDGALFTMRSRLDAIPLDEAARWLIHAHAFDYSGIKSGAVGDDRVKGGRGYPLGVGWCGWLGGTWLEGRSLRETLLLNLVLKREQRSARDVPPWELDPMTSAARNPEEVGPFGQVSLLSWPQRRIRLHAEGNRVTGVLITNGDPLDYTIQHTRELMSGWRYSDPQSKKAKAVRYMPQTLSPERALWRGLASFLPATDREMIARKDGRVPKALPAGVLDWIDELMEAEELAEDYLLGVHVVSMLYGAQMASFSDVAEDRLDFVARLASSEHPELRGIATDAAERAEKTAWELRKLANNLAIAAGDDPERGGEGARMAERAYAVLDREYPRWLRGLRDPATAEQALTVWTRTVRELAGRLAREAVAAAPPAAWIGREHRERHINVAVAERWFRNGLQKILPQADSHDTNDASESPDGSDAAPNTMERSDA